MLFLNGLQDELVPPLHMKTLFEKAKRCEIKEFYSVKNGSHNDTWLKGGEEYYTTMKIFVQKVTKMEKGCMMISSLNNEEEEMSIPTMPHIGVLNYVKECLFGSTHEKSS